jgi:HK97 family phage major capsid protein
MSQTTGQPARTATQVRTFAFELGDLAGRSADAAIPIVVSSDAVVDMPDGPELLVHTADAIDLSRAPLPIIATHRGGQVNIGIVESLAPVGGKLRGLARFGTRQEAADYRADVVAGIIRSVSVGYARVRGTLRKDGVLITSRWMPTHAALVAEPADINAGFFRALDAPPEFQLDTEPESPPVPTPPAAMAAATEKESPVDQSTQAAAGASADNQAAQTRAAGMPAMPTGTTGNPALEMETARRRGIANLCDGNKIENSVRDYWIGSGLSMEAVSDDLLKILQQRGASNPQSAAKLDMSQAETGKYSLVRAILAASDNNWSKAGFEMECSREIAGRMNVVPDSKRFYVPFEVQHRSLPIGKRDLTVAAPTGGGYLVETANVSFVEMLRNRSVAYRMGAMRLGGLQGNVTVPKQTGAASWYWLASESTSITESQQTMGQMALSPKTGGAYTEISRQLLLQSSPSAEALVTADLGRVGGLGIDSAVLAGSGASGQPLGIINTAGIGAVTGTSLAYAGILEFQSDIATANVLPTSGGYVTTPTVAALMMQRVKFASTASPLWEGNLWDGQMAGFGAMSSNQMAAASMLFGDWSAVVVAEWGVLEIEVNPFANFQAGIVGVRAIVSVDCGLRYPAAFSLATTIT